MLAYILRRVVAAAPVILLVAVIVFLVVHLAPGDPVQLMLGPDAHPDVVQAVRAELGLDQPLPVQFVRWVSRLAAGRLGNSLFLDQPVSEAILERIEPTLLLTVAAVLVAVIIGVPSGVVSATRNGTRLDQLFMLVALLGVSMPEFWLGLNLVIIFGVELGWFPVAGYVPLSEGSLLETLSYLVMPACTIGFVQSALIARITRSTMLDVVRQDYMRTAHSKGLAYSTVILKHGLRNALIPIVTAIGLVFALALGGALVVETVFNIPGVGRLLIESVMRRDYPVVQGVVLYIATVYVFFNLLVDLLYVYLNPRVRYG